MSLRSGGSPPHIEPGIGVVATQSLVLMAHGERTLAGIREGVGPAEALAASLALDVTPQGCQGAAVVADGSVAAYSGPVCIPFAGDMQGDGFSTQASMMANPGVPKAMAGAFEARTASTWPADSHRARCGRVGRRGHRGWSRPP